MFSAFGLLDTTTAQLLLFLLWLLKTCIRTSRKLLLELVDTSRRVDELQLAGVERMASVANVDLQFWHSATSRKRIAATAGDRRFLVVGVNIGLHWNLFRIRSVNPSRLGVNAWADLGRIHLERQ